MGWFDTFLKTAQQRVEQTVLPQANADARASKRAAIEAWNNQCQWGWGEGGETGLTWLSTSKLSGPGLTRFNHVSAHKALGRHAIVDHWIDFLDTKTESGFVRSPAVLSRWANIDHDAFWQKLVHVFARATSTTNGLPTLLLQEMPWKSILETAGECGNLSPYRACPRTELRRHASGIVRPHPAVGLWLEREGYVTKEQLVSWVDEKAMPMRDDIDNSFGGSSLGEPVTPEFVAQWCKLFLAEYPLPIEKKVRVVAHVVYAFGIDGWKTHVQPVCAPYLEGIELPLVYAVCGVNTLVPNKHDNAWKLLQTVVDISSEPTKAYDPQSERTLPADSRHANLTMLYELASPEDRIELYFLAYTALQMDRGYKSHVDVLDLPLLA